MTDPIRVGTRASTLARTPNGKHSGLVADRLRDRLPAVTRVEAVGKRD